MILEDKREREGNYKCSELYYVPTCITFVHNYKQAVKHTCMSSVVLTSELEPDGLGFTCYVSLSRG